MLNAIKFYVKTTRRNRLQKKAKKKKEKKLN